MAFYKDILAPLIEEYPMIYADYMANANYVEETPPISFLEEAMDYEEHIKQWLHKVEKFQPFKGVCIV
jgi:hypothetical protein